MSALKLVVSPFLYAMNFLGFSSFKILTSPTLPAMWCDNPHLVVTDVTIKFCSTTDPPPTCTSDPLRWHRIEKDLYLHAAQQSAWLHITRMDEKELTAKDLVVTDIRVGELRPPNPSWESRPAGMWLLRSQYTGDSYQVVTGVDVLFGADAVDPRPQWGLVRPSLQLDAAAEVPPASLTVRHGREESNPGSVRKPLRANEYGIFKIVQISDTHMVTGAGTCKDAIDAHGQPLPDRKADPLTVDFVSGILDVERPDLVILAGDQLHHDIPDSQSAIFKVVAPLIERSIPFAAVFGNHDSEGIHALSRK